MTTEANMDLYYKGIEKKMCEYAAFYYLKFKGYDKDQLFIFDENGLKRFKVNFEKQTTKICKKMKEGHYPDRHKIIATGLKSFLHANVFYFDQKKFDKLYKSENITNETYPVYMLIPNEMYCIDMIAFFINQYSKIKKLDNYSFRLPDNIYNYSDESVHFYSLDLFYLLHGYVNGTLDCAVQELAHIIFLLEMGYELNTYDLKNKYYTN